jgi:hypothetical protein
VVEQPTAVRAAVRALLDKVRSAIPGAVTADLVEPDAGKLWMEVRWIS